MKEILGKWQQPAGQAFPGLYFVFSSDGTFKAALEEMGITSSGTYTAVDGKIDMEQTRHTMGLVGKFYGLYAVEGDTLTMNLGDAGAPRPESLEGRNKRIYKKKA